MINPVTLPEAFVLRMQQQLGDDYPGFEASLQQPPPVSIRLNPKKKSSMEGNPIPWCSTGLYLPIRPSFTLDPYLHAGGYYVQEASSMFLEHAFRHLGLTNKPLRVLDLCGAPGGKSTHIISLLHPESLLVTNEVIRTRASILEENMTKWGFPNVVVTTNDPRDFHQLTGFFDVIVLDAPCSGEGLFRKEPESVNSWSLQQVEHCSMRQRRIIEDIWPCLKHNGVLLYSTCTYAEAENEENIRWLLDNNFGETIELNVPAEWNIQSVQKGDIQAYRFYPHHTNGEGFFMAIIRKTELQHEVLIKPKRTSRTAAVRETDELTNWLIHPEEYSINVQDEQVYFTPASQSEVMHYLQQHLRVLSNGTVMATRKGNRFVPEHSMALSIALNRNTFNCLDVSLDQAREYLRKGNLAAKASSKGYALVTWQELVLGWANVLDNRINNLYPKEWRIRHL